MNERDRIIVEAAKAWLADDTNVWGEESTIVELVEIIDRLDKQLTNIVEAAEPLQFVVANMGSHIQDDDIAYVAKLPGGTQYAYLKIGHIRHLAQAMKDE